MPATISAMTIGCPSRHIMRPMNRESAMMSAAWIMNNARGLWRIPATGPFICLSARPAGRKGHHSAHVEVDECPSKEQAIAGRAERIVVADKHMSTAKEWCRPFPEGLERRSFGMGCFWGAERKFWQLRGVYSTAVGYAAGTPRTRRTARSASGMTGHTEVVLRRVRSEDDRYEELLQGVLGEPRPDAGHAPGQRRGHAVPLRRSTTYDDEQQKRGARRRAMRTRSGSPSGLRRRSPPRSRAAPAFYYAEDYHQQYLAKNPDGYCGLGGTGVSCPVGLASSV